MGKSSESGGWKVNHTMLSMHCGSGYKFWFQPGVVVYAYNPSTLRVELEGTVVQDLPLPT